MGIKKARKHGDAYPGALVHETLHLSVKLSTFRCVCLRPRFEQQFVEPLVAEGTRIPDGLRLIVLAKYYVGAGLWIGAFEEYGVLHPVV